MKAACRGSVSRLVLSATVFFAFVALAAPALAEDRVAPETNARPPEIAWNEIFDLRGNLLDLVDDAGAPASNGIPDAIDRGALHGAAFGEARFLVRPDDVGVRLFATLPGPVSGGGLQVELSRHLAGRAEGDIRIALRPAEEHHAEAVDVRAWALDGASRWTLLPVATTTVGTCNELGTLCAWSNPDGSGVSIEGRLPEGSCHTSARVLATPAGDGVSVRSEGELLTCGLPALFTDRETYPTTAVVPIAGRGFRPSVAYEVVVQRGETDRSAPATAGTPAVARQTVVADAGGRISAHHPLDGAAGTYEARVHAYRGDAPAETDSTVLAVTQFLGTPCGDGEVDGDEQCDQEGDTGECDADCTYAECGDSYQNSSANEDCDEGGFDTESCDADCTLPECGDGHINEQVGEECDDENLDDTDGCIGCASAVCGDGYVYFGNEECDGGGFDTSDCNFDCSWAACGDGHTNAEAREACDDSGFDTTFCDYDCSLPECGDGHVNTEAGEECDDNNTVAADGCSSCLVDSGYRCEGSDPSDCEEIDECTDAQTPHNCAPNATCTNTVGGYTCACDAGYNGDGFICNENYCGDGLQSDPEECDQGSQNHDSIADACRTNCTLPRCGDQVPDTGEECDYGDPDDHHGICVQCALARCGDGYVYLPSPELARRSGSSSALGNAGEECDDGNTDDGDGCAPDCTVENGWDCSSDPGNTSSCSDRDECALETDACSDYATCTNQSPGYDCRCDPGYIGDGFDCQEAPTCEDGIQNQDETGVDCGGSCDACPTCSDGTQNGDETGIDCGGSCDACAECGNGNPEPGEDCDIFGGNGHNGPCPDCKDARCGDGYVYAGVGGLLRTGEGVLPSSPEDCDDGNTDSGDGCSSDCVLEAGYECDAAEPNQCGDIDECAGENPCDDNATCTNSDGGYTCECNSGFSGDGFSCTADPTCDDGVQNGDEEGVDCGGSCPDGCATCGNGATEDPEECDDGNDIDTDACVRGCRNAICGDGFVYTGDSCAVFGRCRRIVGAAEECDEGIDNSDTTPNACRSDCTLARCGDGVVDDGEACDEGSLNSDTLADRCRTDCTVPTCGDGVEDSSEQCDDGNSVTTDTCVHCADAVCGDGYILGGTSVPRIPSVAAEQCDDQNSTSGDGCTNCSIDSGWRCAGAPSVCMDIDECDEDPDACRPGETCTNSPGSYSCQPAAVCGNGRVEQGEQCDDGNDDKDDYCINCRNAYCGDGYIGWNIVVSPPPGVQARLLGEDCDDGNSTSGDGCDSVCFEEPGFRCPDSDDTYPQTTCTDIDECAENSDDCNANATCTNTAGSFSCACNPGYTGDGVTCTPAPSCPNLLQNGEFAGGTANWSSYFSPNTATFSVVAGVARVNVATQTSNGQVYQSSVAMTANTQYRVRFRARNTKGDDVTVQLIKHGAPYTAYFSQAFNLTSVFQDFQATFTAPAFAVNDGRFMFFVSPHDTNSSLYEIEFAVLELASCTAPPAVCGNGTREGAEQCDDGNTANGDGCSATCLTEAVCGNGTREGAEQCDDGNTANGDGCSSSCQNESGGSCPNLVQNGGFSGGTSSWSSHFSPAGPSFNVVGGVARVTIPIQTSNGQIYQAPLALLANTQYRVRFRARNTKGDNLTVQVIKNGPPFSGYASQVFDLTNGFQNLQFTFTTPAFAIPDARLMFFFSPHDTNNTQYEIDDVVLERVTCGG